MAYEKIGFTSGQKLTADNMNHIEDGIANSGTTVVANPSTDGTKDLSKLTVGDTTYNIPSGGSSSGVTLSALHSSGFLSVTIYLTDGTISPLTSLGNGVSNIKAISFTTTSNLSVTTMPQGILIRSDGTIISIGPTNVPQQTAATYYFIPFISGACGTAASAD